MGARGWGTATSFPHPVAAMPLQRYTCGPWFLIPPRSLMRRAWQIGLALLVLLLLVVAAGSAYGVALVRRPFPQTDGHQRDSPDIAPLRPPPPQRGSRARRFTTNPRSTRRRLAISRRPPVARVTGLQIHDEPAQLETRSPAVRRTREARLPAAQLAERCKRGTSTNAPASGRQATKRREPPCGGSRAMNWAD